MVTGSHDWARQVDVAHLEHIRQRPELFAASGVLHLVLEVVAYAADEAALTGQGKCAVTLHADRSVSVVDNGRGTDIRRDEHGKVTRKPVMATKDHRFYDRPTAELLADGHPRHGMSVVAALSDWLEHTNRRKEGAWSQRYVQGVPASDLVGVVPDGTTGTTVHFLPSAGVGPGAAPLAELLLRQSWPPQLTVDVTDQTQRRG